MFPTAARAVPTLLPSDSMLLTGDHRGSPLRCCRGICSFRIKYCRGWRPRQPVRPKGLLFYALRHIRDVESPSPTVLQNKPRSNKRFYRQSKRCDFSATPLFFSGDRGGSPLRCRRGIRIIRKNHCRGWVELQIKKIRPSQKGTDIF